MSTVLRKVSTRTRFAVFDRDGFQCVYCGRGKDDGVQLHVDHKLALANGGTNDMDNLVTACADCNLGKSDKKLSAQTPKRAAPVGKTYGLSFDSDGSAHWQFEIDEASEHAVKVTTFSWMSGEAWSEETVTRTFIEERCLLFTDHKSFIDAVSYWADPRANRINEKFVKAPKRRVADVFG